MADGALGDDDPATDGPATDGPATDGPATDDPATDDPATGGLLAEPEREQPPVPPRLGIAGWLHWGWRQLTSMRTALLLLLLLAVAAVPGSVLPQNRVDPSLVRQYLGDHPALGSWLQRLGLFDVYSSPWFAAIYLLLFVSLIGCVLPRTRLHLRALRAAPPRTPRRLERMPVHLRRTVAATPDEVLRRSTTVLRRRRQWRAGRIREGRGGRHASRHSYQRCQSRSAGKLSIEVRRFLPGPRACVERSGRSGIQQSGGGLCERTNPDRGLVTFDEGHPVRGDTGCLRSTSRPWLKNPKWRHDA